MPLSWNEIKDRALAFSKEWEHETSEEAEAKGFRDGFFTIFGVPRRRPLDKKKVGEVNGNRQVIRRA